MPIISVYRHGMTCGVAPARNSHERSPRGDVGGWSDGSTRRNTRFLYSIQEQQLHGLGFAVTLTVRDCPETAEAWHKLRRAWIMRMTRLGMVRLHWVTEWQRRGVPHLHCALWFSQEAVERLGDVELYMAIQKAWTSLVPSALARSQHVKEIDGPMGWFQYVSKHAARGVRHYQRNSANIPQGWQSRTGRMWGHTGSWPTRDAIKINMEGAEGDGGFYAFRRLVRAWRIADARGDAARHRLAKRVLRCTDPKLSAVRGLSEWVPEAVQDGFLANLSDRGFSVTC